MSDDADERAAERVGAVLNDKWTLEKLIGIGGMAAVYAGLHRNGARAAIKVLHPALARRREIKERFLREGYAANRVSHSGVVKVLDDDEIVSGPDDGGAFLVMELLEGQSVEDRLEHGPKIEERELLPIVRAVLDVLEAAHKAGVIHRDLKPENLFLARDPEKPDGPARIKILDFGLARVAEAGNKTMAGLAIGTPSYMPPEQAAGRVQEIDGRSDLFALGASCFRILADRTVHPADSALAICARMAREPAPTLRSVAPNVSEKTAAAIDRALAFRREDRWPNAAAMRKAVDAAIADLGSDVIPIESGMIEVVEAIKERTRHEVEEAAQASREERPRVDDEAEPERKGSSSFLLWLVLVAVVVGVGVKVGIDRFGLASLWTEPTGAPSASAMVTPVVDAMTETGGGVSVGPLLTVDASFAVDTKMDAEPDDDTDADVDTDDASPTPAGAPDKAHTDAGHADGAAHHPHHPSHHPHGPKHHK